MKDFLAKVTLDHVIIFLVSLASAVISSARNDVGVPIIPRALNVLSGFGLACLAGYAFLESGWLPWLSSGLAYMIGHIGNRIMNAMLVAAKMAELDPLSFAGRVISLVWSWKLPNQK